MKAADAARLVAARAGHVVEPTLEAAGRADILQLRATRRRLPQRRDDVSLAERGALALRALGVDPRIVEGVTLGYLEGDPGRDPAARPVEQLDPGGLLLED